jgi:phosphocarrier protein
MAEVSKTVRIQNELGLHARAASKLVETAARFPVEIQIGHADMMVNSKSIMGVLMLAAAQGTDLQVTATGDQSECQSALDAITALVDGLFGEGR